MQYIRGSACVKGKPNLTVYIYYYYTVADTVHL